MNIKAYFKRKSVSELAEAALNSQELKRSLGAMELVLLGIGAIIGAGIFVLTGAAASQCAGPAIVLSFALSGVACACAGFCYAELASMIPASGSVYTYIYVTLGELPAWIIALLAILSNILVAASVASGWSGYVVSFLADFNIYLPPELTNTTGAVVALADGESVTGIFDLPAFFITMVLTIVLYRGIQTSSMINACIVFIKMSVLGAFIVFGAMHIDPTNWVPFIPQNTGVFGNFGISGIVGGAAMVFLAYNGFDVIATTAQETKNPQRDIPIGILGALLVSTITYVLVSGVLTGLVNYTELNVPQPIGIAVDRMGMPWFSFVVKLGAVAGLTSVVLAMTYGAIRILFAITKDGLLPSFLAKCHEQYKTPNVITLLVGIIVAIIAATIPLTQLVALGNFGTLTTFAFVCFTAVYLRYTQPNLVRKFKCPFMPWIPIFGILLFISILAGLNTEIFIYALIWVVFGIFVYLFYGYYSGRLRWKDNN